ncbi:hypothetical protein E2C01_000322 [Portunus trituberculatus]|uniref:Uncharacterized protein n=1 Tax=Portunus trituberculatus TaxID=210409 RepID=A0A5B7CEM4_PORTR|nr:hypothetical protein [Portunus trituberculatus]
MEALTPQSLQPPTTQRRSPPPLQKQQQKSFMANIHVEVVAGPQPRLRVVLLGARRFSGAGCFDWRRRWSPRE